MHPPEVKQAALELIAADVNDCEISRRLGIPRRTIADWRRPTYVSRPGRSTATCPRCWRPMRPIRVTPGDYAELLGLYLGDGCISDGARTARLRLALDSKYPEIISDAAALLARIFPANEIGLVRGSKGAFQYVSVYSSHLGCLIPQHGSGPKHRRSIALEHWQARALEVAPWPFIRACIRTDGCAFVNRTGIYSYPSYDFTNMSEDIVRLFIGCCDRVEVRTRLTRDARQGIWRVRINRRASVALMDRHVGLKR
jgi:hypothetical protein